jgi:hypothetical protein
MDCYVDGPSINDLSKKLLGLGDFWFDLATIPLTQDVALGSAERTRLTWAYFKAR